MMKENIIEYHKVARQLRKAGIKTELYIGSGKSVGKQLKYADKQMIPIAIIIGSDEFANNQVSLKDLRVIKTEKVEIKDRKEWVEKRVGQKTILMENLVEEIKSLLSGL